MKKTFAVGWATISFLTLFGAGCGPQTQTPPATPPTSPAAKAPTPTPTPTPEPSTPATASETKVDGLTQDDLNKLKLDVQALQTQDLTTLK